MQSRGFEVVRSEHRQHPQADIVLPRRASAASAGYDICTPLALNIAPGERARVATDLKAYMQPGEVLLVYPRSSVGLRGVALCNTVGVIDADYYSNPGNDGNIILCLHNSGPDPFSAAAGDRVAQGVFSPYLLADGDNADAPRLGGHGHSGR